MIQSMAASGTAHRRYRETTVAALAAEPVFAHELPGDRSDPQLPAGTHLIHFVKFQWGYQ
jgi:hypothetical protein